MDVWQWECFLTAFFATQTFVPFRCSTSFNITMRRTTDWLNCQRLNYLASVSEFGRRFQEFLQWIHFLHHHRHLHKPSSVICGEMSRIWRSPLFSHSIWIWSLADGCTWASCSWCLSQSPSFAETACNNNNRNTNDADEDDDGVDAGDDDIKWINLF